MAAKRARKAGKRRKDAGDSRGGKKHARRSGRSGRGGDKAASKPTGRSHGAAGRPGEAGRAAKEAGPAEAASRTGELIDMEQAIALLKTTRPTFYRWLRAGRIKGMKLGRQWRFYREDVERFLKGEAPRIDLPADITPLIKALRKRVKEAGGRDVSPEGATPVERVTSLIIVLGVVTRASDIHITPHMAGDETETKAHLRYRVDGVLHRAAEIDLRLLPAIVEQWKRMAACDVHENKKPQDGRIVVRLSELGDSRSDKTIDLRVSFLPACMGEAVTVRILDPAQVTLDLANIDYAPDVRERLLRAVHAPWGLIVVTGPTGCGKTTTLYSCLREVTRPEVKVISIEDPVEYFLPWVTQVQVMTSAGLTFPRAARAALRSDPDVILLGETRDAETLWIVHEAALTGHLVMTTLHTDEAASTLTRMVEIGVNPFVVGDATKLVLAQRLIRKLCPHCSVPEKPAANRLDAAGEMARKGGLEWRSLERKFRRPVGCPKCGETGYKGRTVIAEALEVSPEIGKALRDGASVDELRRIAVEQGMTTMPADGVRRAAAGETTLDEVMRVIGYSLA